MKSLRKTRAGVLVGVTLALLAGSGATPLPAPDSKDRVAFSHALPAMDGSRLKVTVVEVTYPPGGASASHSHPCPVVGYVIEGEYRTQVKGGPVAIVRAGETFYEEPNGVHTVSANASDKRPVRFLAYFTCDNDAPLSAPAQAAAAGK